MFTDQTAVVATFVVYLVLMLLIGWYAWRQTHDLSDYILGGRRLGPGVAALSAGASDMSGWLLLGLPGYAYASGVQAGWLALGLLAGTWANWRVVAQRLRRYSQHAGDALTLPAFFEQRFHDHTRALRVISALFILLFFLFYTASGLVAGGKLFQTVFGLPYGWAVAAGALAIVGYTFFGGFLAVSWTDVVQGLLMAAALVIVPIVAITDIGGLHALQAHMARVNPDLLDIFGGHGSKALSTVAIISLLAWGLGYFGQPHILARFKAIRSPRDVGPARRIAVSWTALTLVGAMLVGLSGIGYVQPALTGADTEKVFMVLVGAMFHPVVAGILLAAILAAIMSTADSQLLVSSSALAEDFYKALLRPGAGATELVWIGRAAVLALAIAAYLLALDPNSKVLDLVAYAWAGFGAAFGPTLLLALYWRRMNAVGALAGIVAGGVTVVVWKQLGPLLAHFDVAVPAGLVDVLKLYEIVPGFIVSLAAIVVASLVTRAPSDAVALQHRQFENLC